MSGPHPAAPHRLPPPCPVCADLPGSPHGVPAPPAATPGQAACEAYGSDRWANVGPSGRACWDAAAQAAIATAVAAERERIRQMAIACRAAAISPTGRMTPFAELLERSPEENAAALLKVVEDARGGLGGGDHA